MVVNPRQAHDFAKALGYLSKTDKSDAQALAQFTHTLYSGDKREQLLLKLPTAQQDELAAMVTRRNQLVACVWLKATGWQVAIKRSAKASQQCLKSLIARSKHWTTILLVAWLSTLKPSSICSKA